MKKILPLILIFIVIGISIYSHFLSKDENINIPNVNLEIEKDTIENIEFEEGNMENSGGASTVYVENIEMINDFLDLDMMLIYRDIVIVQGITIPKLVTSDVEKHYEDNKELLFQIFGINSLEEFILINELILESNISKHDAFSFGKINEINLDGNLLKVNLTYVYEDKSVELSHFVNYVFINGEPHLYIYN